MKKICKYCGGSLFVIVKKNKTVGNSQAHLYCKNIECGRHNQFCGINQVKLYEDRTKQEENKEPTQQELLFFLDGDIDTCGKCKYYKNPQVNNRIFCQLSGEDKTFVSAICKDFQRG